MIQHQICVCEHKIEYYLYDSYKYLVLSLQPTQTKGGKHGGMGKVITVHGQCLLQRLPYKNV